MLRIRPATMDDAARLHEWANHPETLTAMRTSAPISWDSHVEWLRDKLADASTVIHIAELDGRPIAVVRYEPRPYGHELSVTLDPGLRGNGLGAAILRASAEVFPLRPVVADTKPFNTRFMRAAEAAGYLREGPTPDGMVRLRLS